jgi:hypothetical protein
MELVVANHYKQQTKFEFNFKQQTKWNLKGVIEASKNSVLMYHLSLT